MRPQRGDASERLIGIELLHHRADGGQRFSRIARRAHQQVVDGDTRRLEMRQVDGWGRRQLEIQAPDIPTTPMTCSGLSSMTIV